ncbi:MAG TPA: endonuclease/exonuclease/phosphatase family protein [Acidimicrobiales bacterium]|nr:endonuclease/exonuclease/phosphatase family protein [Acidimicrobiales bacterium]
MPSAVVATYNLHGGVDGWGRPFDVVAACRAVDADVLVVQESWAPDAGASTASRVADALGYAVTELAMARGRMLSAPPGAGSRWGPPLWARSRYGMRLYRRGRAGATRDARHGPGTTEVERGSWGIAVLSRLPVAGTRLIDLGQLPADPARRGAIAVDVVLAGSVPLLVVGTHMAHLSQGSPRHLRALRRTLADSEERPAVLAGDMNMWGPPLSVALPGWSRAARGRSWPSWWRHPLAQSDHVLVTGSVRVERGEVLRLPGSDHYPVRATLVVGAP